MGIRCHLAIVGQLVESGQVDVASCHSICEVRSREIFVALPVLFRTSLYDLASGHVKQRARLYLRFTDSSHHSKS